MRKLDEVGRVEKIVGVCLLLLLASIVTWFVTYSRSNKDYLFVVGDTGEVAEDAGPTGHAWLVARQMLPSFGEGTWVEGGAVEVVDAADVPDVFVGLTADAAAFDVQSVFHRVYRTAAEPPVDVAIAVCDAVTPVQAFGLFRSRQPSPHVRVSVGHDGWSSQDGARVGFWNGRYFTEFVFSSPPNASSSLTPDAASMAVNSIAAVQLTYGGPFFADDVLPPEGRVADTFRYVHRSALGIDGFDEVFLVDLSGDVTAWVTDAKSASGAGSTVERLSATATPSGGPGDAEHGGDGYGEAESHGSDNAGEIRTEGPFTVGALPTGWSAYFSAGRFVYGATGAAPPAVLATVKTIHLAVASIGLAPSSQVRASSSTEDSPFPDPGTAGWHAPRSVQRFTPDNLYEKINGRAGAYLGFNVVGMTFGTYYNARDAERTVDVYWYDMGEPTNAFGIYRAEAAAEATPIAMGRGGYVTDGSIFFWKGAAYVQVLPSGTGEDDALVAQSIAERIAERITDTGSAQGPDALLPEDGRVAGSLNYVAANAFELEFLNKVYTAAYDTGSGRIVMFIHETAGEAEASALFETYAAFLESYGTVIAQAPGQSRRIVSGKIAGLVDVVFATGPYIAGVAGAEDAAAAQRAAEAFFDDLEAR